MNKVFNKLKDIQSYKRINFNYGHGLVCLNNCKASPGDLAFDSDFGQVYYNGVEWVQPDQAVRNIINTLHNINSELEETKELIKSGHYY